MLTLIVVAKSLRVVISPFHVLFNRFCKKIAGDELLAITSGRNLERVHAVQRYIYNQVDRVVHIRVQRVQNSRSQIEKVSFFEFMMKRVYDEVTDLVV